MSLPMLLTLVVLVGATKSFISMIRNQESILQFGAHIETD